MEDKFEFSFDDEVADKFCYDIGEKKIEIHFSGYQNLLTGGVFLDSPCIFVIEKWKSAKCRLGDEKKRYDLNDQIGVIDMILYMKKAGNDLEMLVITLDSRYLTILFSEPVVTLIRKKSYFSRLTKSFEVRWRILFNFSDVRWMSPF